MSDEITASNHTAAPVVQGVVSQFSPGPWHCWVDPNRLEGHIYGADGFKIYDMFNGSTAMPRVVANSRLIAAAPELFDVADALCKSLACAGVAAVEDSNDPLESLHFRAIKAMTKAISG